MNIADLEKLGAFVSPSLDKIPVEWKHIFDGEERVDKFDIYIKKLSFGGFDRIYDISNKDKSTTALLISETVRLGEKGEQSLTYDDADRLEPSLAFALNEAINKYAESKKKEAKDSKKKQSKKSGTN